MQQYIQARVDLENNRLRFDELKDSIETSVRNAVRNAEVSYRQLELARQARELSRQKLEIEQEKLKTGRSTNFQLVNFQNDLTSSEINELSAMIRYLNALTDLDLTLGTTLVTWGVEVEAIPLPDLKNEPTGDGK
jgi:outer membrane protein TolC